MKGSIFQFALLIAVVAAFPVDDEKYGFHHVQHRESVDAARQGMNERLALLQRPVGSQRIQGSSRCSSCLPGESFSQTQSSRLSSSRSSSNSLGSDYVGVGYVGHSDDEDIQRRVSPSLPSHSHSRYSSSNAYHEEEEEDVQQRQLVPTDLHGIQSSAYRSSANREEEEEDTQRSIGIGYHDASVSNDGSQSYTRRTQHQREHYESETSRSTPKVYYVSAPVSSSSQRLASSTGSESDYQETRTAPQKISLQVRPGTTTVLQVPIRVLNTAGVPESNQQYSSNSRLSSSGYQESVQQHVNPTQRVTYYVAPITSDRYDASRSGSETSRTSYVQQQPEKYTAPDLTAYNSFGSRSHIEDESDVQTRVRPQSTSLIDGGSSRYASTSSAQSENAQRTHTRVVPAFPIQTVESSSASSRRTAEEQRERQYSSSRPSYINRTPITAEESRRTEGSSSYGSSGSTVYRPVSISSQPSSISQSSRSNFAGNNYSPYSPSYSPSRYGSGTVSSSSDNLHEYMSESQRLAEMQQRQLASSSQQSQSSASYASAAEANRRTLDLASRLDSTAANFVHSQNLANRNSEFDTEDVAAQSVGNGGYQRVKSWQKQSKWESGSQYGTDGKPKTYSMLSTAEAEKHNINGQSTGYKAATTTLENDGKVSTYSIHTP